MKITACVAIMASMLMTGCASTVTTYDAQGKIIGSCKAERGFVIGGGSHCEGRANQEGRNR